MCRTDHIYKAMIEKDMSNENIHESSRYLDYTLESICGVDSLEELIKYYEPLRDLYSEELKDRVYHISVFKFEGVYYFYMVKFLRGG